MPYIPKQYDSAKAFSKNYNNLGNILDPLDNDRLKAYDLYDDFYFNRPETFKVTIRGESDTEIYLPSTKKIIDSTARFLAVEFGYTLTGGDQSAVQTYMDNLFAREEISKRFIKSKKSMLNRGDMAWYITADPNKQAGERLSVSTIHPSCVFPIEDPTNEFRVIGYHLVDIIHDPRDKTNDINKRVARRQTYRKENGGISSEAILFEIGKWDDRRLRPDELRPVWRLWEKFMLRSQIKTLPVYLIPNNEPDGSSWGLSQVAGIEYIINALNQSMTYEDLSLVLQGLGVYVTTASPPIDKTTGRKGKYRLHPGNVVELSQGDTFDRVTGVASVAPFQDHLKLLDEWATSGTGLPDMATGAVDVSVAQSGIALALKMGPIIAENSDKQLGIGGKWDQIGYDLITQWLPAYENLNSPGTKWVSTFGDPMPVDRTAKIAELVQLFEADMITYDEMRDGLEILGYKHLSNAEQKLLDQAAKKADAAGGTGLMNEGGATAGDLMDELINSGGSSIDSGVNGSTVNA